MQKRKEFKRQKELKNKKEPIKHYVLVFFVFDFSGILVHSETEFAARRGPKATLCEESQNMRMFRFLTFVRKDKEQKGAHAGAPQRQQTTAM